MISYTIARLDPTTAKEYICSNHYSHGCHKSPSLSLGLYDGEKLIGVLMFATPCSENVRASIFGKEYVSHVIELHRLHILDCTPKNTESWFISRCLKLLKQYRPEIWAVISFSDITEGHSGVIYKATNAYRLGTTSAATFYKDKDGRLRHPRQCGKNISMSEALRMGWTPTHRQGKNRYMWLLPVSKKNKKELIQMCKYELKGD